MPFDFMPPFTPDSRANLVKKSIVTRLRDEETPTRWLYLRGPDEAARQVMMLGGDACVACNVNTRYGNEYSHCFRFDEGISKNVTELVEVLKRVLSLTKRRYLDFALALDWYKAPDPHIDPMYWPNTDIGELVSRGKYWAQGQKQSTAYDQLVDRVSAIIRDHPFYRGARIVVTVPGHNGDGRSFGERLAYRVAKTTGKIVVQTISVDGPRPPRKEGTWQNLENAFRIPTALSGDVIVIDDVYRSGQTMSAVALAARRAGAQRVAGLAAVRTMRN